MTRLSLPPPPPLAAGVDPATQIGLTTSQADFAHAAAAEIARRQCEALRLYETLAKQEIMHASRASVRIMRGGNRSGKSTWGFIEVARAATGQDPFNKYQTNQPLIIWILGYDSDHIGRVIYAKLFRAGAFKMIRDLDTGEWRAFKPWEEADKDREREAKPAPPLIPPRFIDQTSWDWENKRGKVFKSVMLKNGVEIRAYSSKGEPAQGSECDLIAIDEDIFNEGWATEAEARLSDRRGRLIWMAFPHSKNDALVEFSNQASEQEAEFDPDVKEEVLIFADNPHIPEDEKRKRLRSWEHNSPDELRARNAGEFIYDSVLMYPSFAKQIHASDWEHGNLTGGEMDTYLRKHDYVLPHDWTKYMVVDPGHTVCAVGFYAIPNSAFGDYVLMYDELYLRRCNPEMFGEEVKKKVGVQHFYKFIIDEHAARQTSMATGTTLRKVYSAQLSKRDVTCELTGPGFSPGTDDVPMRTAMMASWLQIRGNGTTKFRVLADRCPNVCMEFQKYKKRVVHDAAQDKPIPRHNHLMNCCEYLAGSRPAYEIPTRHPTLGSSAYRAFKSWEKKDAGKNRAGSSQMYLGPGKAPASLASY